MKDEINELIKCLEEKYKYFKDYINELKTIKEKDAYTIFWLNDLEYVFDELEHLLKNLKELMKDEG